MKNIVTRFFKNKKQASMMTKKEAILRSLMRKESQEIGAEIFGPIPKGHRREFFCLDDHTWVWHEEWTDEKGKNQILNTRYDIRPNEILKSQNNGGYQRLSIDEAKNFSKAVDKYINRVGKEIYNRQIV
jgi:hypothetical protein